MSFLSHHSSPLFHIKLKFAGHPIAFIALKQQHQNAFQEAHQQQEQDQEAAAEEGCFCEAI